MNFFTSSGVRKKSDSGDWQLTKVTGRLNSSLIFRQIAVVSSSGEGLMDSTAGNGKDGRISALLVSIKWAGRVFSRLRMSVCIGSSMPFKDRLAIEL